MPCPAGAQAIAAPGVLRRLELLGTGEPEADEVRLEHVETSSDGGLRSPAALRSST